MDWSHLYTAIGAVFTALVGYGGVRAVRTILSYREGVQKLDKEKRADVLDEYRELLERRSKDNDDLRKELKVVREDSERRDAACQAENAELRERAGRAEERIQALEDALNNAGIKYRPYTRYPEGPGAHRPLPEKSKE